MKSTQRLPLGRTFPFEPGEKPTLAKVFRAFLDAAGTRTAGSKDIDFILVEVPINPDEAKKVLPWGMRLDRSVPGRIFVASYGQAIFSPPYNEASLLVPVKTPYGKGGTACWMVVDQDLALIYGRSALACPKKLAEFSIEEKGDSVSAQVTRRGIPLISIEARKIEPETDPEFIFEARAYNAGGLGQMFFLNLVWTFTLKETIYESYRAEGTLELRDSPYDPFRNLVGDFQNPLPMRIAKFDMVGSSIPIPVWFAGVRWFLNTYTLRFG